MIHILQNEFSFFFKPSNICSQFSKKLKYHKIFEFTVNDTGKHRVVLINLWWVFIDKTFRVYLAIIDLLVSDKDCIIIIMVMKSTNETG